LITDYLDSDGNHIKENTKDKFKGSMLFASKNAFNFVRTSRRDDLISLVYLLIFLMDYSRLRFISKVEKLNKKDKFNLIKE
jgi:hypothetical protein